MFKTVLGIINQDQTRSETASITGPYYLEALSSRHRLRNCEIKNIVVEDTRHGRSRQPLLPSTRDSQISRVWRTAHEVRVRAC